MEKAKELFQMVDEYVKNSEAIIEYYTLLVGKIVSFLTQVKEKAPSLIPTSFKINIHDLIGNNEILSKFGYKAIRLRLELCDWNKVKVKWANYIEIKMTPEHSPTNDAIDYFGQIDIYYCRETKTIETKIPSIPQLTYKSNGVYTKYPLMMVVLSLVITAEDMVISKIIEDVKNEISPFTEFVSDVINQYKFVSETTEITKMAR